jgi:hypothetical protein
MARRILVAALALGLATGCFVFDELDGAKDMMDHPSFPARGPVAEKDDPPAPPPAAAAKPAAPSAPAKVLADMQAWWKEARTLSSEAVDEDLVRCELGGRSQFMRHDDCLARGGRAERAGR